mgnify:CR=1 FL=1
MTHKKTERIKKSYVQDNEDLTIHPLDCVPSYRPKGSWTNGVKAWKRATSGEPEQVVGWFHPPRRRNKNHLKWSSSKRKFVPRR